MSIKSLCIVIALSASLAHSTHGAGLIGTEFTYQGRLSFNGAAATGLYDFQFTLYAEPDLEVLFGGPQQIPSVGVTNGLFTVTLDFGLPLAFINGNASWLGIAVRTNGAVDFTRLEPRSPLVSAPYAIHARHADFAKRAAVGGTANSSVFDVEVNNQRALRLTATLTSPNLIGGFESNAVTGGAAGATIAGGGSNDLVNLVTDNYGAVGGGAGNRAGDNVAPPTSAPYATVGGGLRNVSSGEASTIAGGRDNQSGGSFSLVGGGFQNVNRSYGAVIGGGFNNENSFSDYSFIGGGARNLSSANYSVIAGGSDNAASSYAAAISGGSFNAVSAEYATVGGGRQNRVESNAFYATIAGGTLNLVRSNAQYATIGGGVGNAIYFDADDATVAGGRNNRIQTNAVGSTIGGGTINLIQSEAMYSFIGGGYGNAVQSNASHAAIGGGYGNAVQTNAHYATLAGGERNVIQSNADHAVIGGGLHNTVLRNSAFATIPGGRDNSATNYAFAAGSFARANHTGSFVWGDSTPEYISSTANNQFTVRASGGTQFLTDPILTVGVQLAPGGNSWAPTSDRNMKDNFQAVDARQILRRVVGLPIQTYNMKTQDPSIRHIGPMAQDFKAAFGVGEDDRHITTVDADGVALAAIQGLYEILREKESQIEKLQTQNDRLEKRLSTLEAALANK